MARTDDESVVVSIKDLDVEVVVLTLAKIAFFANGASLPYAEPPAVGNGETTDPVAYNRHADSPTLFAAYRSMLRQNSVMGLQCVYDVMALARTTIVGTASTYNPHRKGKDEGGMQTASGESYDPVAWTAAIHIDLRDQFGGVRYGQLYRPVYALVENGDKRAIVKINDVGPLRPGRVIDLNERSMRYFDSDLQRGLLSDVKVTLLPGTDWTPGPVGGLEVASLADAL